MPNWAFSYLEVIGDPEHLSEFKSKLKTKTVEHGYLEGTTYYKIIPSLIPMPEEFVGTDSGFNIKGLVKASEEAQEKWGVDNWYAWQHKYWGVKWGDCHTTLENENLDNGTLSYLDFRLDFAWGIPEPALIKISAMFPNLRFFLDTEEEAGFFHGSMTFENGTITENNLKDGPSPEQIAAEKSFIRQRALSDTELNEDAIDALLEGDKQHIIWKIIAEKQALCQS